MCAAEPVVVAFAANDNHATLLAVALHSTLTHLQSGTELHVYVLDGGFHSSSKKKLSCVAARHRHLDVALNWVLPDTTALLPLESSGHIGDLIGFLDLLVPEALPSSCDRAIYLDADLLVQADLHKLWQVDLHGRALGAVQSVVSPYVSSPGALPNYGELGLDPATPYFNAGVMVLDLKRWREDQISGQVIESFLGSKKHRRRLFARYGLRLHDQYGLNSVLAADWEMLDPRWNVVASIVRAKPWQSSASKRALEAAREHLLADAYIHHFTGPKPWRLECEHPAKTAWRRCVEESDWLDPVARSQVTRSPVHEQRASPARAACHDAAKVTLAIPTRNRSKFLKSCLESALAQEFAELQITVLDDASSDDTEAVVATCGDPRVRYVRNESHLGPFNCWLRAIAESASEYVAVVPDDDILLPGFVSSSIAGLTAAPSAAFSTGAARYIDAAGRPIGTQQVCGFTAGVVSGSDFLHRIVDSPVFRSEPATVMFRGAALATLGSSGAPHTKQLFDFNWLIRLAAHHDLVFIDDVLAEVRQHPLQTRRAAFCLIEGSGPLALLAERTDAACYLLQSERAADASYRHWLATRLLALNRDRSALLRRLVPSLDFAWAERRAIGAQEIRCTVAPGELFALVDEELWGPDEFPDRRAHRFIERDGEYYGAPPDDGVAIEELGRSRQTGTAWMVFGWPSFWWFDSYPEFARYLRSSFRVVLENDRILAFDLRQGPEA